MRPRSKDHSFKGDLWHVLNDPDDIRYVWFHHFINALILVSVVIVVWEEVGSPPKNWLRGLKIVDTAILWIFLVEFTARLWVLKAFLPRAVRLTTLGRLRYWSLSKLRFVLTPWGLVDFIALLPILAPMFPFLRSLRILRLLRVFRSFQFFRYARPLRTLGVAFRDNSLLFAVSMGFVVSAIVLAALLFYVAEVKANPDVVSLADTLWWSIVTVTTVGFGDITPVTSGGKVIGGALMLAGMFIIALFAGVISSTLVGHLLPLRVEQVRMSAISDHIVIAGWNEEVPMLLEEMAREFREDMPPVLVFALRARPPSLPDEYVFVQGDFRREREYDKVRLKFARAVVAVADNAGDASPAVRDASTVLTVFTLRSFEEKLGDERTAPLHVVAEILDPENHSHAIVAGANEVIETTRLGSSVLAHTACNVGIGSVIAQLVHASNQNIYSTTLPSSLRRAELLTFAQIQDEAREKLGILVIGIEHDGQLRLNPPGDHTFFMHDKVVYIGPRQP